MKKKTPLLLGSLAVILAGAGILIGILLPKEKPEKHVGEKLPKALGYTQNAISKLEVTNIYMAERRNSPILMRSGPFFPGLKT